jgi:hypothetical protein
MNIFVLDPCPVKSARMMNDKHVVKMICESAQMLANCFPVCDLSSAGCPRTKTDGVRKYSHWNHPCSLWVRASVGNMQWLIDHALALCDEKKVRYPNRPEHWDRQFLRWAVNNLHRASPVKHGRTEFAIAISQDSMCRQQPEFETLDIHGKYRLYYLFDKAHIAKWTRRAVPDFVMKFHERDKNA